MGIQGRALFQLRRYDEALCVIEASIERNPGFDRTHLHHAATLARLGRLEDAAWSIDEALSISPDFSLTSERSESLYCDPADIDHYIESLRMAGLPE